MNKRIGYLQLIRGGALAVFGASALLLCGCGTLCRGKTQGVYRGTQGDAGLLFMGLSPQSIVCENNPNLVTEVGLRTMCVVAGIADLPISLVIDTLCLPFDLTMEHERVAKRRANLRSLAEIMSKCVPPGAEVLDRPPAGAYLPDPSPTTRVVGTGMDWTIGRRGGVSERYYHPGIPGTYIKEFRLEDESGEAYLLVIRIRTGQGQYPHNKKH